MMRSMLTMAALLLSAASIGLPGPDSAADCPRGMLDKQYCGWDGDLVADLPLDEKQWANPDTLIFAYTPVEAVVPKGQARIRVQISAAHEPEHLDTAIAAFRKVGSSLGVV